MIMCGAVSCIPDLRSWFCSATIEEVGPLPVSLSPEDQNQALLAQAWKDAHKLRNEFFQTKATERIDQSQIVIILNI